MQRSRLRGRGTAEGGGGGSNKLNRSAEFTRQLIPAVSEHEKLPSSPRRAGARDERTAGDIEGHGGRPVAGRGAEQPATSEAEFCRTIRQATGRAGATVPFASPSKPTSIDRRGESLAQTADYRAWGSAPPVPAYPSTRGRKAGGGFATSANRMFTEVLQNITGTDRTSFSLCSDSIHGVTHAHAQATRIAHVHP